MKTDNSEADTSPDRGRHWVRFAVASLLLTAPALTCWVVTTEPTARQAPSQLPLTLNGLDPLPMFSANAHRFLKVAMYFSHPPSQADPSTISHWLLFRDLRTERRVVSAADCQRIIDYLLNDRKCRDPLLPDQPILVPHEHGVRYRARIAGTGPSIRPKVAGELHAGQVLCILAKSRVPLTQEVSVEGSVFHVQDILNNAAWNFCLEEEIEWRACALALYRPHVAKWTNRFGEEITWPMITNELLRRWETRTLSEYSCGGTHILGCLALLDRVDQQVRLWDALRRGHVENALSEVVVFLERNQLDDGSWDMQWFGKSSRDATKSATDSFQRVLLTGHHLEWIHLLPKDRRPTEQSLARAGSFVIEHIEGADATAISEGICHFSHGIRAYLAAGLKLIPGVPYATN